MYNIFIYFLPQRLAKCKKFFVFTWIFRNPKTCFQTNLFSGKKGADGYVVVAPFWQTYSIYPSDAEMEALIRNSTVYLEERDYVNSEKLGLTGFCAGGRYTMLFLPQIKEFKSGVAWYGFPYTGGAKIQPDKPASLIDQLNAPMLMIHGTRDQATTFLTSTDTQMNWMLLTNTSN
ncbi:dienelactone hydrolase family protein [Methanosarcina sp. Z-7115]|uniref:Dienelactone hydrolase family protein n=1 Tax=Methanosarcina baikalica TaxID=3073890 RepID=A0ABU2D3N1_9EURY|nr:dienelactone hydrolase family protein [Methanosarcina sp. Z-7115]MDR7666573.1 dienelactone hydrolase family protein [Methanosarcina sp. Z-7115]